MSLVWVGWFLFVLVSFAAIEAYAIRHNGATLSYSVWRLSKAWPPFPFVLGMVVGGLGIHFFWNWCPV